MPDMEELFRSVLAQDSAPIVLCDLAHTILYMNPAAIARYAYAGGEALVGKSLLACHTPQANAAIERVLAWFAADKSHNIVYTFRNDEENKDVYMVALRSAAGDLIGYYEKHEYRSRETRALYDLR